MRICGLFLAAVLAMSATLSAQDQAPADPQAERIAKLEKDLAEQKKQTETLITQAAQAAKPKPPEPTAEEKKAQMRAAWAQAFTQARDSAALGCKDSGGKLTAITLDNTGKPSATCSY